MAEEEEEEEEEENEEEYRWAPRRHRSSTRNYITHRDPRSTDSVIEIACYFIELIHCVVYELIHCVVYDEDFFCILYMWVVIIIHNTIHTDMFDKIW